MINSQFSFQDKRGPRLFIRPSWQALFIFAILFKLMLTGLLIGPRLGAWEQRLSYSSREAAVASQQGHYDDMGYMEIARWLAATGELLSPYYEDEVPQVHRTPGYVAILAFGGMLTGWSLPLMLLAQILVLSLIPVVFRQILQVLNWPGWVAWLMVFDPLTNILSLSFMTEGWLVLALLLVMRLWLAGDRPGNRILAFVLFGVAILIKPTAQFFMIVLLILSLLLMRNRLLTLGAFVAGLLPVGLWMFRNYLLCGLFVISTQSDGVIVVKYILESKRTGESVGALMKERGREDGVSVHSRIIDNDFDFKDEVKAYLLENPVQFVKYHALGGARVLFGTAREHIQQVFWLGREPPAMFMQGFNGVMILWYLVVYAGLAALFRFEFLTSRSTWFSLLFIGYNIALIGIFAYEVGGGLKRVVFVPWLYLLLAQGLTFSGWGWPGGWLTKKLGLTRVPGLFMKRKESELAAASNS
jgi:hypothetical protein